MLWSKLLSYLVKSGDLTVTDAAGKAHKFGVAGQKPKSAIRLHDTRLHYQLFFYPEFYLGEAYMNGTLTMEEGSLNDFIELLAINASALGPNILEKISTRLAPITQLLLQYNPLGVAQKNVAPHYDISDKLYELFLDKDMLYSCAYFTDQNNSLEQAQQDKIRHIAAKLRIEPGMRVLDIGSGWGGLAMYLTRKLGADVTGISLSGEQVKKATARVEAAGLQNNIRFLQKDYREITDSFDRIVSVGMMEHVGVGFYKQFFAKIRGLLKDDGNALIHCIGRFDGPGNTNPWLRKYIFPGGYAPALSEVTRIVEKSGLLMTDIEILRMHYAYTLHEWQNRFRQNKEAVLKMYDERFYRMWEFYLVSAEMEFSHMGTMVFHLQLTKKIDVLPLTRDYMVDGERKLGAA